MSVAVSAPGAVPSGVLLFLDGAATLGSVTVPSSGTATWTASALTQGTHVFWAYYKGSASTAGECFPHYHDEHCRGADDTGQHGDDGDDHESRREIRPLPW